MIRFLPVRCLFRPGSLTKTAADFMPWQAARVRRMALRRATPRTRQRVGFHMLAPSAVIFKHKRRPSRFHSRAGSPRPGGRAGQEGSGMSDAIVSGVPQQLVKNGEISVIKETALAPDHGEMIVHLKIL